MELKALQLVVIKSLPPAFIAAHETADCLSHLTIQDIMGRAHVQYGTLSKVELTEANARLRLPMQPNETDADVISRQRVVNRERTDAGQAGPNYRQVSNLVEALQHNPVVHGVVIDFY
jgi:hypothetical protein